MTIVNAQNYSDFMCNNYIANGLYNTLYDVYS